MTKPLEIRKDVDLREYNTFGIAAKADRFVELSDGDSYRALLDSGLLRQYPFFILGGGSNVVFPDRYEGTVVHPANKGVRLVGDEGGYCFVEAASGEVWADFVDCCIGNGWHGLENLAAIPGSVGAAPVQNVGAYGREAKDVVWRVHSLDIATGEERWIEASDCQFGYRWSVFKGELKGCCLIDRVLFRLETEYHPDLSYKALASALTERGIVSPTARQVADTVAAVRDSKLPNPKEIGSAGSFFKNPVVSEEKYLSLKAEYPDIVAFEVKRDASSPADDERHYKLAAGWLIERCGWKGRTLGRAGVYEKQALVLVNRGGCTGKDVRSLADAVITDVASRFALTLECEAIFVGENCEL